MSWATGSAAGGAFSPVANPRESAASLARTPKSAALALSAGTSAEFVPSFGRPPPSKVEWGTQRPGVSYLSSLSATTSATDTTAQSRLATAASADVAEFVPRSLTTSTASTSSSNSAPTTMHSNVGVPRQPSIHQYTAAAQQQAGPPPPPTTTSSSSSPSSTPSGRVDPLPLISTPGYVCKKVARRVRLETGMPSVGTPLAVRLPSLGTLRAWPEPGARERTDEVTPSTALWGRPTRLFVGRSVITGQWAMLRRVDGARLAAQSHLDEPVGRWKRFSHPVLVPLREGFVSSAFSDAGSSLCFVHDFVPGTVGVSQYFFGTRMAAKASPAHVWSYTCQLAALCGAAHASGLALRTALSPSKLLVSLDDDRIYAGSCAVSDVLSAGDGSAPPLAVAQREDLAAIGRLIVMLATGSLTALAVDAPAALAHTEAVLGPDLKALAMQLLTTRSPTVTVGALLATLGPRMAEQLGRSYAHTDVLERSLSREVENGRIARLLIKLGFVNERPEFFGDSKWSETGDRYLLKLFRDYVFHQVNEFGAPVVDYGHVLDTLNKLDAGSPEELVLVSRDESTFMRISYADLKKAAASAFQELIVAAR
eukprot:CAMPEP_0170736858 /NCGR_PEP_ID=MMETSP0437-20130122/3829_1 /TAXON_ID=0 /ORGANISM="Sexangularia sp." /LENGTH=594 /DNA_ID=CAMNT_0011075229 /DNA_START=42 /DNA_END=1826 /DNA_ORIENTATION=+